MHYTLSTLLFVAAVVLNATTAAPTKLQGRSFKVHRQRQLSYAPNGLAALQKTYRKYGWTLPSAITNVSSTSRVQLSSTAASNTSTYDSTSTSTSATESATATATPEQNDQEFLAPINIGPQTLLLDFDTGSADLWLFSTALPASQRTTHTLYSPSKSPTFSRLPNASWRISYGDSSGASGTVGTETVSIGGATVTSQAIELATSVSAAFTADTQSDGLLGLAFSTLNTVTPQKQKTFFDNVMPDLAAPLFTAALKHAVPGAYEFGFLDATLFTGDLVYAPVDPQHGFWEFASASFAVGGGAEQVNAGASAAVADTGTSLMLVDEAVAAAYWAEVKGARVDAAQGGWVFPCQESLPDFRVLVGGEGQGQGGWATVQGGLLNFADVGGGSCFGGLQGNNGQGIQIFGDVFFKALFVVFDGGNTRLGFAPHA
ncbi:Aspartic peptidase, active site [Lasallia pustulata]|uniref:Aspartic peptidase, active site n=1 Tax=Lasallia pustulata TaxID=136370 RepID=A0A1W5D8K1_9LECA|nr:Aspartic peptidase, active site [Lasallia pustulata]